MIDKIINTFSYFTYKKNNLFSLYIFLAFNILCLTACVDKKAYISSDEKPYVLTTFTILISSILSVFATPLDSIGTKTVDDKTYIIHQVEQGETLYRLKVKYNVSVEEIKAANNNTSSLAIGQKVLIPTNIKVKQPDSNIKFHTVAPGETLYRVASTYGVSVDEVKKWNNLTSNSLCNLPLILRTFPTSSLRH